MEGVVPGVPDLFVPELRLWIEMKKPGGRLSEAQKSMIEYLEGIGHTVIVAYGARDASMKVLEFLKWNHGTEASITTTTMVPISDKAGRYNIFSTPPGARMLVSGRTRAPTPTPPRERRSRCTPEKFTMWRSKSLHFWLCFFGDLNNSQLLIVSIIYLWV